MDFFVSPVFIIILLVIVLALAAFVAYQYTLLSKIKKSREALMTKTEMDLEQILNSHEKDIMEVKNDIGGIYKIADKLHTMASQSIQKVGVIRFNPFAGEGEGGDQSFAIALLDENDNGFVISSLYGRNETRSFAKPLVKGEAKHHLSDEEKQAIAKAKEQYKK